MNLFFLILYIFVSPLPPFVLFFTKSNIIIIVPSIVSVSVVSVADLIIDDGAYYLLHASTLHLLLLLLWLLLLCGQCSSSFSSSCDCDRCYCCYCCCCSLVTNTLPVLVSFVCQLLLHYGIPLWCCIYCCQWIGYSFFSTNFFLYIDPNAAAIRVVLV